MSPPWSFLIRIYFSLFEEDISDFSSSGLDPFSNLPIPSISRQSGKQITEEVQGGVLYSPIHIDLIIDSFLCGILTNNSWN